MFSLLFTKAQGKPQAEGHVWMEVCRPSLGLTLQVPKWDRLSKPIR